jgi:ubiquitin-conjugating enzyme E2 O
MIVSTGLDGTVTVRLGASQPCRDISVDLDYILAILDEEARFHEPHDTLMDLGDWDAYASNWSEEGSVGTISESVEYEGGERLDNDSGDDNWVSEGDEDPPGTGRGRRTNEDEDVEMTDAQVPDDESMMVAEPLRSLLQLQTKLGSEKPPQFLVLDCEPPADQFGLHATGADGTSLKRIVREHGILSSALPEGEIYVRTYESRLDLLRCLIVGPRDTPYEHAPFLVDLCLLKDFPNQPPLAHFHSWTSGLGRINPNLYEEGKICLSLLGTWSGKNESEKWNDKATLLQLLVSLQGLVFVKNPFYNEAGFEGYEHETRYARESEQYNEKAFLMARRFVQHALLRPPGGLEDILAWLYLPHDSSDPGSTSLLSTVIQRGQRLIEQSAAARQGQDSRLMDSAGDTATPDRVFLRPLSRGASVMLQRILDELQGQLRQLSSGNAPETIPTS